MSIMSAIIDNEDAIRYVLDSKGNKTAVLIPIGLWNQWKGEKKPDDPGSSFSPKKYRGILKGIGVSGREEEKNLRDEWD